MLKSPVCAGFAILMAFAGQVRAEVAAEMVIKGAPAYRICAACHSLQPGVHLSGPSLADLWGKKAASIAGYGRYTEALKKADIVWDKDTLNAQLRATRPPVTVPGPVSRGSAACRPRVR